MTREQLRAIADRYVAGDKPATIAAALDLDVAEVEASLPGARVAAPRAAAAARPKRRKASASTPAAPERAPTDVADPATVAGRDGPASHRNHGYGYASIRAGGRRWL